MVQIGPILMDLSNGNRGIRKHKCKNATYFFNKSFWRNHICGVLGYVDLCTVEYLGDGNPSPSARGSDELGVSGKVAPRRTRCIAGRCRAEYASAVYRKAGR